MSDLLQSCSSSLLSKFKRIHKGSVWRRVADLPFIRSSCESFHHRLLAIGGYDSDSDKYSTAVYMYNSATNSWEVISHMTTARKCCFTAALPDNQLMVVGGWTNGHNNIMTDTVEVASVCN